MTLALSLTRDLIKPVKSLSGFKKSFKVPEDAGPSNESFVARLADDDINLELEKIHPKLRQRFNFKRKDLQVNQSDGGTGSIATPGFEYSISVFINPENPSQIVWHYEVNEISDPNEILAEAFDIVFNEIFNAVRFTPAEPVDLESFVDRIEAAEDPRIKLDYDMNVTLCDIRMDGIDGKIKLTSDALTLVHGQPASPKLLLESFLELHGVLVASSEFEEMDLKSRNP